MNRKQTLMAVLAVTIGFGFTHPAPVAGQTTQDDAATSYDVARRLLNSAQWMQAVEKFRLYREADTGARYAAESLYWEAYALSRMESTRYWRQATASWPIEVILSLLSGSTGSRSGMPSSSRSRLPSSSRSRLKVRTRPS